MQPGTKLAQFPFIYARDHHHTDFLLSRDLQLWYKLKPELESCKGFRILQNLCSLPRVMIYVFWILPFPPLVLWIVRYPMQWYTDTQYMLAVIFYNYLFYMCFSVYMIMGMFVWVVTKDNLCGLVLSFYHVGFWDETQVVRLVAITFNCWAITPSQL